MRFYSMTAATRTIMQTNSNLLLANRRKSTALMQAFAGNATRMADTKGTAHLCIVDPNDSSKLSSRAFNSIRHIITRSAMVKFRRKFLGSTQVPATKNHVFYVPFIPYIAGTAAWPEFYAARKLSLELSLEPPGCGCHGRSGLLRALSSQSTQTPSSTIPLAWRRFCIGGE